ncbi:MAG TPA: translation elongation factor-like protein [Candidatus Paceibacterota bacterium]
MEEKPIGEVTHYYSHLEVAIVKFNRKVKAGETVHFKGATTDFTQPIESMEFDHKSVTEAELGKEIGIKVSDKVREGDEVYAVV